MVDNVKTTHLHRVNLIDTV